MFFSMSCGQDFSDQKINDNGSEQKQDVLWSGNRSHTIKHHACRKDPGIFPFAGYYKIDCQKNRQKDKNKL